MAHTGHTTRHTHEALPAGRGARSRGVARLGLVAISVAVAFAASIPVRAQDAGFFSGARIGLTDKAWTFAAPGLKLGQALEYARPGEPGNTAFGGYQFENGFALGAALNTEPSEALYRSGRGSGGLGLRFDGLRWADTRPNVNVDVVSAFNWRNSLSVFGKLGVGRSDARSTPEWAAATVSAADRTAISYGLGVRYDFTPSLGLKLELTRGTRFGLDRLRTDVDADAVNFGVRWTF
ncbi:MAG: porin family protein [Burkholderiales bacterium]|nr:porin family protein [Burkholderiales bacterium]